jgi:hypothetical protein
VTSAPRPGAVAGVHARRAWPTIPADLAAERLADAAAGAVARGALASGRSSNAAPCETSEIRPRLHRCCPTSTGATRRSSPRRSRLDLRSRRRRRGPDATRRAGSLIDTSGSSQLMVRRVTTRRPIETALGELVSLRSERPRRGDTSPPCPSDSRRPPELLVTSPPASSSTRGVLAARRHDVGGDRDVADSARVDPASGRGALARLDVGLRVARTVAVAAGGCRRVRSVPPQTPLLSWAPPVVNSDVACGCTVTKPPPCCSRPSEARDRPVARTMDMPGASRRGLTSIGAVGVHSQADGLPG